jgi:triosephosphate isomerase (TIM)
MRTPFVTANWKMYKTVHEAVLYAKEFRNLAKDIADVEIVLAPPFTAIAAVAEAARNTNLKVSAQDLSWEREGAFTGEVSGSMLREAGADYVIVGHSERRRLFGEDDTVVNRKATAAFAADLTPIVCIGETLQQRQDGQTLEVLDRQLSVGLEGLTNVLVGELVIAYEPVWAIGTGVNATPEQAGQAHSHIRSRLKQWFGADAAEACHVIYGGSVKPDNAAELCGLQDVDGALVGGASLDPSAFLQIVKACRPSARKAASP